MKITPLLAYSFVLPLALLPLGCQHHDHAHHAGHDAHAGGPPAAHAHGENWSAVKELVAAVHPTTGNKCSGWVRFTQAGEHVKVSAHVEGLAPNQKHAMHIHEFGDCTSPDGNSAGGHYNPEGHQHGLVEQAHRHAGDLGNLQADAAGKAHYEITVANISLAGLKNPIIGRAVIIHAKPDDGGQPTGNAGGRIGCGTIGIVKPTP